MGMRRDKRKCPELTDGGRVHLWTSQEARGTGSKGIGELGVRILQRKDELQMSEHFVFILGDY